MRMSKIYSVAYWEFSEKVKTKSFLISLILTPIFMIVVGVIPTILAMKEPDTTKHVAVLDQTNSLASKLDATLKKKHMLENNKPMFELEIIDSKLSVNQGMEKVKKDILNEDLLGMFFIPKDIVIERKAEYYGLNVANGQETEKLFSSLLETIKKDEFMKLGIDTAVYSKISKPIDTKLIKVTKSGEKEETSFLQQFGSAYGAIIIVMILVITSAQLLVRSLLEEKNNRIMEILLSSCSPTELMFGKLGGLGALGVFQALVWILMAVVGTLLFDVKVFNIESLLLVLLLSISGFLLFASLMIGIGSSVTTEQEAQNITGYIVMLAVLPVIFVVPIIEEPSGTIANALSYIPFTAPMIMSSRIMLQMPDWWEIGLSLLSIYGSMLVFLIVSAKIFRVGVLAYGKRLTLPEIIKLLREK